MTGILVIAIVAILYVTYVHRGNKFQEIERQQALRRAVIRLSEKNQPFGR